MRRSIVPIRVVGVAAGSWVDPVRVFPLRFGSALVVVEAWRRLAFGFLAGRVRVVRHSAALALAHDDRADAAGVGSDRYREQEQRADQSFHVFTAIVCQLYEIGACRKSASLYAATPLNRKASLIT